MAQLGFIDAVSGGASLLNTLLSTVTGVYKSKTEQEAYDKAVKMQKRQEQKAEEERAIALAKARAQQTADLALQLSVQRRQEQQMMLMIVGGVALVAAGIFVFSAVKARPAQTGVKKK